MLTIDGAMGEGGGQVLRSSLALSIATGTPVRIENVRAGREKPGLLRQHLASLRAAMAISGAEAEGAELGSRSVVFRPGPGRGGAHTFAVGSAGSTMLVLQTVLPPLLAAAARGETSELVLEGGTHNSKAPPFEFISRALLPLLARSGARIEATLERAGFYPAGGGRARVRIEPSGKLAEIVLLERGETVGRRARALISRIPGHVGKRELEVVREKLGWPDEALRIDSVRDAGGPGNALLLEIESEHVTEVVTSFGARGIAAERVAQDAVDEARRYLASGAPVGEHLADQLLLPMALASGGAFRTLPLTLHTTTNIEVLHRFLEARIVVREDEATRTQVVEVRV